MHIDLEEVEHMRKVAEEAANRADAFDYDRGYHHGYARALLEVIQGNFEQVDEDDV